jgi:hypothetical protein
MPIKRLPADIPSYMELRKQFDGEAPARPPKRAIIAVSSPRVVGRTGTVMIKGSAAVPALGHNAIFDAAVEAYGVIDAMRIFVDRGTAGYSEVVRAGGVDGLAKPYPRRSRSVQLARALPADVVETVMVWVDPLSLLKPSRTAGIILSQIVAWHLGKA